MLYIGEHYYACDNAVWYESAQATGPWKVCVEVPKEVQDIPPSSASYNVKYVYVYERTPEWCMWATRRATPAAIRTAPRWSTAPAITT